MITRVKDMLRLNQVSAWLFALAVLLLSQGSSSEVTACGAAVHPPADVEITDPGFLGYLSIRWTRPSSLQNLADCTVRYQLRYYDTYEERWRSVRTFNLNYSAQFDLEKPVKVKILTILKCSCTNETEVQGEETEAVYTPESTGVAESRIRDFDCVYYGKEYMECTWQSGPVQPLNSQHYLYYWHKDMDETQECPEYFESSAGRRGCRFPQQSLLEFSKFNMCVNGSSPAGSLRAAYFSFEIQNLVKPVVISSVEVSEIDEQLKLDWSPPSGQVPEHCLDYEVERSSLMENGEQQQERKILENLDVDTFYEIPRAAESKKTCFRIRSKMNMYCADGGFWSDWSQIKCTDEKVSPNKPTFIYNLVGLVAICILGLVILCLSLWTLKKICIKQTTEKDVLYTLYKQKVNETFLIPIFK